MPKLLSHGICPIKIYGFWPSWDLGVYWVLLGFRQKYTHACPCMCACTHTNTGLNTLLNRSGERVSLSYCRFWWEGFQLLTVEYYVDCGFVISGFYYVDVSSLYTHFGESFYHKWMLNFLHLFSMRWQWHPTPVLLPGKSHGWRILVGCSPWGH